MFTDIEDAEAIFLQRSYGRAHHHRGEVCSPNIAQKRSRQPVSHSTGVHVQRHAEGMSAPAITEVCAPIILQKRRRCLMSHSTRDVGVSSVTHQRNRCLASSRGGVSVLITTGCVWVCPLFIGDGGRRTVKHRRCTCLLFRRGYVGVLILTEMTCGYSCYRMEKEWVPVVPVS